MIAFISLSKLKLKQGKILKRKILVCIHFKLIHSSLFEIPIRKVTTLKNRKSLTKRMTSADTDRTLKTDNKTHRGKTHEPEFLKNSPLIKRISH